MNDDFIAQVWIAFAHGHWSTGDGAGGSSQGSRLPAPAKVLDSLQSISKLPEELQAWGRLVYAGDNYCQSKALRDKKLVFLYMMGFVGVELGSLKSRAVIRMTENMICAEGRRTLKHTKSDIAKSAGVDPKSAHRGWFDEAFRAVDIESRRMTQECGWAAIDAAA